MGRKNRRKEGGWHNASGKPSALVLPTDGGVCVRGVRSQVFMMMLPSGGSALLAVAAILPLPSLPPTQAKTEILYDEIDSLTKGGFPDETAALFQESISWKAMKEAEREAREKDGPVDAEGLLMGVSNMLMKLAPEARAKHLASIAAACGFTAGGVFDFMNALPATEQEPARG